MIIMSVFAQDSHKQVNNVQNCKPVSLRELQSQTQEEFGALLPSVLDRAFEGEL
jgi:hypothetical protein